MWFTRIFGFEESSVDIFKRFKYVRNCLIDSKTDNRYYCGEFEIKRLASMRANNPLNNYNSEIKFSEIVSDITELHNNPENEYAVFQVASQFNCLEMASPEYTPEMGIDIYDEDNTQGPKCAICCGSGTLYRNYFLNCGQPQINTLSDLSNQINPTNDIWNMVNGYLIFVDEYSAKYIDDLILLSGSHYSNYYSTGIQKLTEVNNSQNHQLVTQVYCSAVPINYNLRINPRIYSNFCKFILDCIYEITFYIALENYNLTGNGKLFLTLVGTGAFGNPEAWAISSIQKALRKFEKTPLDIKIVSYKNKNNNLIDLL